MQNREKVGKKPLEGKVLVNVDAAFDADSGKGATGVVIRDFFRYGSIVPTSVLIDAHNHVLYLKRQYRKTIHLQFF
jgi:hypothetical protein